MKDVSQMKNRNVEPSMYTELERILIDAYDLGHRATTMTSGSGLFTARMPFGTYPDTG